MVGGVIRSRRAVSEMTSALLMVTIVILSFGVTYPFVRNFISTYRSGTGLRIQERFVIEDVWFHDGNQVTIHFLNNGKADITVNTVFLRPLSGGVEQRFQFTSTSSGGSDLELPVGDSGWGIVTFDYDLAKTYHVVAITNRGNYVEGDYEASQV